MGAKLWPLGPHCGAIPEINKTTPRVDESVVARLGPASSSGSLGGLYTDEAMCEFQSWYCIFGFTASPWLNACIAHELHTFLVSTKELRAYSPPSRRKVVLQAACVYAWAAFVASWTLIGRSASGMPHRANAAGGMACLPIEFSTGSTMFFWLVFVPTFIGAPLLYIVYVAVHTWRNKLIDKRRSLASRQARRTTAVAAVLPPNTTVTAHRILFTALRSPPPRPPASRSTFCASSSSSWSCGGRASSSSSSSTCARSGRGGRAAAGRTCRAWSRWR